MAVKTNFVRYDDGIHVKTIEKPESVSYNQHTGMWEIQHLVGKGVLHRVTTKVKKILEIEETVS